MISWQRHRNEHKNIVYDIVIFSLTKFDLMIENNIVLSENIGNQSMFQSMT